MEQKPEIVQRYENDPKGYYDPVELEDIFHYYAENGMVEYLKPVLDLSIALHPDDQSTRIMQAEYQLNLGSAEECLRLLEPIFQEENPYLCILRSGALAKMSQLEEAIDWAETACSLNDDPFISYDLGIGFLNAQQYEISLRYFLRCHDQSPDDLRCLLGILYCLGKIGTAEEVLSFAEKATQVDPLCWEAWISKGSAQCELEQNDEALESFDYAIAIRPEAAETYVHKATLLSELNRQDEALAALEEGAPYAEGDELGNLMLLRAHIYEKKNMRADAIEATWRALEASPLSDDICNRSVQSFIQLEANQEAIVFLLAAYNRGAREVSLLATLGELLAKEERTEEALDVYSEMHKIVNNSGTAGMLGTTYMQLGRFRKAYQILRDSYKSDPIWQTAVLLATCAFELDWYTAFERHLTTAYMLEEKRSGEFLRSLSEGLYEYCEKHGIFARIRKAQQELLCQEVIQGLRKQLDIQSEADSALAELLNLNDEDENEDINNINN